MPFIIHILLGALVAWLTIVTDTAIPIFIGYCFFIFLLFVWPTAAWWFLGLVVLLALLWLIVVMWEAVAGIILGFVMFMFLILGLLSAAARADEIHDKVPFDVCIEAVSDLLEVEYSKWTTVKEQSGPNFDRTIKVQGDRQVEITCTKNEMITKTGPREIHLQTDIQVAPKK